MPTGSAQARVTVRPKYQDTSENSEVSRYPLGSIASFFGLACLKRPNYFNSVLQKYRLPPDPNQQYMFSRPAPHRGAFRDRHGRWRRDAVDARRRADEALHLADGEVVWS
jgi:hypothetical protein